MKLIFLTLVIAFCSSAFANQITFINLQDSTQIDITKAINKIQLVTSLKNPENFTVRGVLNDPRIAVAEFYDEIKLSPNELLLPIFTHEMAHLLIYYNLRLDVKEMDERHSLNMQFKILSAFTPGWNDLRLILSSQYDPRLFSLHFEEVFGDLLASHIFKDAGIIDRVESIKGYRNFDMPYPTEPHPRFWDEHYSLQAFGKYIYNNYLKPKKAAPKIVFDTFYEVIKNETEFYATSVADLEKNPLMTPSIVSKKNGLLTFNNQNINEYLHILQKKFDTIILNDIKI